jgi:hypothetical protein
LIQQLHLILKFHYLLIQQLLLLEMPVFFPGLMLQVLASIPFGSSESHFPDPRVCGSIHSIPSNALQGRDILGISIAHSMADQKRRSEWAEMAQLEWTIQ